MLTKLMSQDASEFVTLTSFQGYQVKVHSFYYFDYYKSDSNSCHTLSAHVLCLRSDLASSTALLICKASKNKSCFSSAPTSISGLKKKNPCGILLAGKRIFSFLPVLKASVKTYQNWVKIASKFVPIFHTENLHPIQIYQLYPKRVSPSLPPPFQIFFF